jgi:hypothetical protein
MLHWNMLGTVQRGCALLQGQRFARNVSRYTYLRNYKLCHDQQHYEDLRSHSPYEGKS